MSVTPEGLVYLFNHCLIPAEFIEILVNNNGAFMSRTREAAEDSVPRRLSKHYVESLPGTFDMCVLIAGLGIWIKCPTSLFLNSAIYFSCDLQTLETTVIVFGTYLSQIISRLQAIFPRNCAERVLATKDPFVVLSAIVAEYSSLMEYERRRLDFAIREHESKTGASAHMYDESFRAQTQEYAILNQALHVTEGYVTFFHRTLNFQIDLITFLRQQHLQFKALQATKLLKAARNSMINSTLTGRKIDSSRNEGRVYPRHTGRDTGHDCPIRASKLGDRKSRPSMSHRRSSLQDLINLEE